MKKILLIAFFIAITVLIYSDFNMSWEYFYGGTNNDEINHFILTDDGGFLTAGYTESFGQGIWGKPDSWIIKFNESGQIEWDYTYGQPDSLDKAYFILETTGGYIIAGERMEDIVYGNGAGGIIFKIDEDGNEIWSHKYGGSQGDMLRHIQPVESGGFIACGTTRSFDAGFIDGYVVKIDEYGIVEWQNNFGGTGYEVFKQIYPTNDGGYIAAGFSNSDGFGSYDIWVVKMDSSGNLEWEQRIGDANSNRMHYFSPTNDGNYILTGETENASEEMELFAMKIDTSANVLWEHIYPATVQGEGKYIEEVSDGGFIIGGTDSNSLSGPWQTDGWIIKIDENGNFQYDYFVHSSANDGINVVRQVSNDTFIAAGGNMSYGSGMNDAWIIKLVDNAVDADEDNEFEISNYSLSNYPNPFNPTTTISFSIQEESKVDLSIFNIKGNKIKTLFNEPNTKGNYSVVWNGKDTNDRSVASGIYFYKLEAGKKVIINKMLMLK